MGTGALFFIAIAAVILLIKRILIANIDGNFAISAEIRRVLLIYKKAAQFMIYKLKKGPKTYKYWVKEDFNNGVKKI